MDYIKVLNEKLNETVPVLKQLDLYYAGKQPAAFLSDKSKEALGGRLSAMAVNFPRLAVTSLAERLTVMGFKTAEGMDPELWTAWKRNRMIDGAAQAHVDALVYGRSYAIVWADDHGAPVVSVESAHQVATITDPVTRRVVSALKRWTDLDGNGRAVLYGADEIKVLTCGRVVDTTVYPSQGWVVTEKIPNPLGVVPVIPILNRGRLLDTDGVSEMTDILGLSDALNKLMGDALVSSEFYARPRRWATGLEIVEDEDGNPVNPFSNEDGKLWQSESPETKFGQFDAARLDGYADLTAVVTQQIGALAGLPPHYLGLHGDQPASADAIRSAEASLVARCYELQRGFGQAWADVASLVKAIQTGVDPMAVELEPVWANPETRTPAQQADAAAKLAGIGVPLQTLLTEVLDWAPEKVAETVSAARVQQLISTGVGK